MTNLWCQGLNIQETWKSQGCASYSSTSSFVFPTAGAVSLSEVCGHFQDHIQTTGCDWLFTWFLQVLVHGLCTVVPLYCTWNTCSCLQGSILLFPPPQDSEHKHPESHMARAELGAESFTRWSMPRMALGEKEVTNAILDPAMSTHSQAWLAAILVWRDSAGFWGSYSALNPQKGLSTKVSHFEVFQFTLSIPALCNTTIQTVIDSKRKVFYIKKLKKTAVILSVKPRWFGKQHVSYIQISLKITIFHSYPQPDP